MSLVVIARNEAHNIGRCIQSARFVAEVLVAENESFDKTSEVAESFGARVIHPPWQGFGRQKKFAALQAQQDWILALDADEALSQELQKEILENFSSLQPDTVYYFPRKSFHLSRWIKHGGWYPDRQPRLFHRKHSMWNEAEIHESVEGKQQAFFKSDLEHYVFRDLSQQVMTNDRYSTLQAQDYVKAGKKFSFFKAMTKPWVKFIECYFLKLGFMDGYPGFVIAVGAAYSVFIRWAKIWEIQRRK